MEGFANVVVASVDGGGVAVGAAVIADDVDAGADCDGASDRTKNVTALGGGGTVIIGDSPEFSDFAMISSAGAQSSNAAPIPSMAAATGSVAVGVLLAWSGVPLLKSFPGAGRMAMSIGTSLWWSSSSASVSSPATRR